MSDDHSHGGVGSGVATKEEHAAWLAEQDRIVAEVNRKRQERLAREAERSNDPPSIRVVKSSKQHGYVQYVVVPPKTWRPDLIYPMLRCYDARGNRCIETAFTQTLPDQWGKFRPGMADRRWGQYAKAVMVAQASPGGITGPEVVVWEPQPEHLEGATGAPGAEAKAAPPETAPVAKPEPKPKAEKEARKAKRLRKRRRRRKRLENRRQKGA